MPMYKRMIIPVAVSRDAVDKGVRNELECVSNNTFANIILQLSSLSKMSEDLFTELHLETCCVFYRTCQIIKRVEALKYKIIQLNPIAEEVSLRDITQREPFSSGVEKDQEIITVATRPRAINDMYLSIEKPPCLHVLDPYREDGKKSIKFYTDPGYFFELWQKQMAANTEVQLKKKNAKVKRKLSKRLLDNGETKSPTADPSNHQPANFTPLPQLPQLPCPYDNSSISSADPVLLQQQQQQQEALLQQQYELEQQLLQQQQQQAYQLFNTDQQSAWNTNQAANVDQMAYKGQGYTDGGLPPRPLSPNTLPPLPPDYPEADFVSPPDFVPDPSYFARSDSTDNFNDLPPPPPIYPDPSLEATPPPPIHPTQLSDSLNDSYMPSPPHILPSQQEGSLFKFSAGVEDLLSRIEGTHLITTPLKSTRDNTPVRQSPNDHTLTHQTSPKDQHPSPYNATSPLSQPAIHISRNSSSRQNFERNNSVLSQSNGVVANDHQQQQQSLQHQITQQRSQQHEQHQLQQQHSQQQHPQQQQNRNVDNKSDLLSAIRTGIQLRKVAETKQQKKRRTTGRLDVQTIMEAAFEVRRKAMEGDDEEEEEEDGTWSD